MQILYCIAMMTTIYECLFPLVRIKSQGANIVHCCRLVLNNAIAFLVVTSQAFKDVSTKLRGRNLGIEFIMNKTVSKFV